MQSATIKLSLLTAGISLALALPHVANARGTIAPPAHGRPHTTRTRVTPKTPEAPQDAKSVANNNGKQTKNPTTLTTVSVYGDVPNGYGSNYVQVGAFRAQTALDTPETVNVLTRSLLNAQNDTTIFGALKNSPGVTRSQTGGMFADNLTIRGLPVNNRTNVRLNGSLPINNLMAIPMWNVARVAVLKGTSALYYGFTTPGGIINFVTKRAGNRPNLSFEMLLNDNGKKIGAVDAGTKFGSRHQFGVRVNLAAGDTGNYGIQHVSGQNSFGSIAADWEPSDNVMLSMDYERALLRVNEQAIIETPDPVDGTITLPRLPKYSKLLSPGPWAYTNGNMTNWIGKAVVEISDNWQVIASVGRAETNRENRALGIFALSNTLTGDGTLSLFQSHGEQFLNKNYRVELVGLIQTGPISNQITVGFTRNKFFENHPKGIGSVVYDENLYDPQIFSPVIPASKISTLRPVRTRDDGTYLVDRIRFSSKWQVIIGARHADFRVTGYKSPTANTHYHATPTSPFAAVIYQPMDNLSIYASHIEGLQQGDVAPSLDDVVNPAQVFGPQISHQTEVGVKWSVNQRLNATVAYFNIRVPTPGYLIPASTPGMKRFVDSGESRYRGIEVNLVGEVTPELKVVVGGMLLRARQISAPLPSQVGMIPDGTPEQTLNAFLDYEPSWAPNFGFSFGEYYVGRRPLGPAEQGFLEGHTTFSAGARYTAKLGGTRKLTFQLNANNLTNTRYWAGGNGYITPGRSRTVSLAIKLTWL